MVNTTKEEVEIEEYATAKEVNGIRRILDSFMKKREERNDSMEKTLARYWAP